MDDVVLLILLSVAMFVGSYVAGSLPLVVPFSESRLRLITVLGAGLLVGTALAVIIPEGVQSIYGAAESSDAAHANRHGHGIAPPASVVDLHNHKNDASVPVVAPARNNQIIQQPNDIADHHAHKKESGNFVRKDDKAVGQSEIGQQSAKIEKSDRAKAKQLPLPLAGIETRTRKKRDGDHKAPPKPIDPAAGLEKAVGADHANDVDFPDQHDDSHQQSFSGHGGGHSHKKTDAHGTVGLALVAGFVLMLLVDQLAQHRTGRDVDLSGGVALQPRYKITATIGLVVHAAADGVALGAASSSSHSEIQLIVFLAIMLHKAPASFGLVTFLLHEGLDKPRIRRHLLIFALSAPVAAIVTYLFISQSGNKEKLTSMNTTGILLLFSAGTFLYVATVHVLPEVAAGDHHHSGAGGGHARSGFKLNELIALVVGAVAPTFLTLGHSH